LPKETAATAQDTNVGVKSILKEIPPIGDVLLTPEGAIESFTVKLKGETISYDRAAPSEHFTVLNDGAIVLFQQPDQKQKPDATFLCVLPAGKGVFGFWKKLPGQHNAYVWAKSLKNDSTIQVDGASVFPLQDTLRGTTTNADLLKDPAIEQLQKDLRAIRSTLPMEYDKVTPVKFVHDKLRDVIKIMDERNEPIDRNRLPWVTQAK
jgi:hypothetical protein